MLRFVWKSLRHSFRLHLLVPLLLFVCSEFVIAYFASEEVNRYWFVHQFFPRLVALYIAFIVVLGLVMAEEGAARVTNLGALEGALEDANGYFAVSPTSTREWFDPAAQVYLARVIAAKLTNQGFAHRRVLLFYSAGDLRDVKATYLDGYHAQCLADWHMYFDIPVRFLRVHEIANVLAKLSGAERKVIGYRHWYPRRFWMWRLKRSGRLAFAVVTHANAGRSGIVRFHKSKHELEVSYHTDEPTVRAYSAVADVIREQAETEGHDFVHYMFGVPGPAL